MFAAATRVFTLARASLSGCVLHLGQEFLLEATLLQARSFGSGLIVRNVCSQDLRIALRDVVSRVLFQSGACGLTK